MSLIGKKDCRTILFFEGDYNNDVLLHTQPEALERMHGHCIAGAFVDSKGRRITNKLFLGRKLINGEWLEGLYTLGFIRIGEELTCYHSFFKQKDFAAAIQEIRIDPENLAELEKILAEIAS